MVVVFKVATASSKSTSIPPDNAVKKYYGNAEGCIHSHDKSRAQRKQRDPRGREDKVDEERYAEFDGVMRTANVKARVGLPAWCIPLPFTCIQLSPIVRLPLATRRYGKRRFDRGDVWRGV